MKEIYSNRAFKIMHISFSKGKIMPRHTSSTDAFIIVEKGHANLVMNESIIDLSQGAKHLIPAFESHELRITEDFSACVILKNEATIEYKKNEKDKVFKLKN